MRDSRHHRIGIGIGIGTTEHTRAEEPIGVPVERVGDIATRARRVDDVVSGAGQGIEGVYMLPLLAGQYLGRPIEAGAVPPRQPGAPPIPHRECLRRGGHQRTIDVSVAYSSTRSAASRPEIKTIGTPTPGTVDDPTKNNPGTRLSRLFGRNGPV